MAQTVRARIIRKHQWSGGQTFLAQCRKDVKKIGGVVFFISAGVEVVLGRALSFAARYELVLSVLLDCYVPVLGRRSPRAVLQLFSGRRAISKRRQLPIHRDLEKQLLSTNRRPNRLLVYRTDTYSSLGCVGLLNLTESKFIPIGEPIVGKDRAYFANRFREGTSAYSL
jgi:hypothetical protein